MWYGNTKCKGIRKKGGWLCAADYRSWLTELRVRRDDLFCTGFSFGWREMKTRWSSTSHTKKWVLKSSWREKGWWWWSWWWCGRFKQCCCIAIPSFLLVFLFECLLTPALLPWSIFDRQQSSDPTIFIL